MKAIWGALWWERGGFDDKEHILYEDCLPKLFRTRQACRLWIREHYGYIKGRKDLREYPHGWRVPKAVKLEIKPLER